MSGSSDDYGRAEGEVPSPRTGDPPSPAVRVPSLPITQVGDRLEHAIEARSEPIQPERRIGPRLRRTAFWLAITGVSLYLVAPSLIETLGSWEDLDRLSPW